MNRPVFDVAVLGTSLSTGPSSHEWLSETMRRACVGKNGIFFTYTLGAPGQYSSWGKLNVAPVVRLRPRACLIEFLINDSYTGGGLTVAQSRANHQSMIADIREGSPETMIFLMTMNPPIGPAVPTHPQYAAFNAMYADLASDTNVGLIDIRSIWGSPTSTQIADGVHPTLAALRAVTIPAVASVLRGMIQ